MSDTLNSIRHISDNELSKTCMSTNPVVNGFALSSLGTWSNYRRSFLKTVQSYLKKENRNVLQKYFCFNILILREICRRAEWLRGRTLHKMLKSSLNDAKEFSTKS